jgi:hypothetical protein
MVSRENRVISAAFVLALLSIVVSIVYVPRSYSAFVSALALVGVGFVAPQLYLAARGDSLSRTRVRVGGLVGAGYAAALATNAPEERLFTLLGVAVSERLLLFGFAGVLFFGLLAYELAAGYRDASN